MQNELIVDAIAVGLGAALSWKDSQKFDKVHVVVYATKLVVAGVGDNQTRK